MGRPRPRAGHNERPINGHKHRGIQAGLAGITHRIRRV